MLEIFLLAALLMAAKTTSRRTRRRGLMVIRVKAVNTLGALADATVIKVDLATGSVEDIFLISADLTVTLSGHTAAEGPIVVGVAHDDYSVAEIKEWLEVTNSFDQSDLIANEQMRRRCREICTFPGLDTDEVWSGRVPLKFVVEGGNDLCLWAYNYSGAALTAGSLVKVTGKIFFRRMR